MKGRGFTLLEVMMGTLITSFVFAGVLSAYIFLGRGLARQVNEESLESRTRLALYWFTQDVSTAITITAQNPGTGVSGTQITLAVPSAGTVTYACDWSRGSTNGYLTRQVGSGAVLTLLTNLKSFSSGYDDASGNSITAPASAPSSPQIKIKQAYMAYTSVAGTASTGAHSRALQWSPPG